MSGAAEGATTTAKLQEPAKAGSEPAKDQPKASAPLEEDDEFEDFPVEGMSSYRSIKCPFEKRLTLATTDWNQADAEVLGGNTHLWEESWDDDEANEDFSKQLK